MKNDLIRLIFILAAIFLIQRSGSCFPLRTEEVTFSNKDCNLSGSVILPKGEGPFNAVVFIHGSGPEERSNSRSLANEFADHGYAALIYDKRGVGKSGGDPKSVQYYSIEDLSNDAIAAVKYLASRTDVTPKHIGLVAFSQGGWVASLAADKDSGIAFMVVISGSVTTISEDNYFERAARLKKEGFTSEDIDQANEMHLLDLEVSRSGSSFEKFQALWAKYKTAPWFKRVYLSENPIAADHNYRKWYKTVMDFDPVMHLEKSSQPALWIYGDAALDQYCPVEKSIKAIEQLKQSGKDYEIQTFPGANHSLVKGSKRVDIEVPIFNWLKKVKP